MKNKLFAACAIVFTMALTAIAQADIKIIKNTRMDIPGMPAGMKNPVTGEIMDPGKMPPKTILIKGQRMLTETRQEQKGPTGTMKTIISQLKQCDLGRDLSYTNKSKKYTAAYFNSAPKQATKGKQEIKASGGGTVTFTMSYTDTGERREILGYPARRVKSVMTTTPSADACEKRSMKMETDAWLIDLPKFSCPMFSPPAEAPGIGGEGGCNDKIIYNIVGKPDNGFAVKETMTMSMAGNPPMTMTSEVTEIAKTELDAQLFEVPPGYTESKESIRESQNAAAPDSSASQQPAFSAAAPSPSQPAALNSDGLGPKRAGVVRVGIAKPNIKMPDSKDDTTGPLQLSAAVRDSFVESLKGETIEAIRLSTDTPESEARQKECDYIFYANVTQKRGGGGMFGKMVAMGAMTAVSVLVPGVGGLIAGTVGNVVMSQTMNKTAKAKDEFTLDYKVTDPAGTLLSQAVTKAKTKEDGEDVLTPQLKQASATVLGEINRKRAQ